MADSNAFILFSMFFIGSFAKQQQEHEAFDKAQKAYYQYINGDEYIKRFVPQGFEKYKDIAVIGTMIMEQKIIYVYNFK